MLFLLLLICVEYNDGICDCGDVCFRIYMCGNYLKKCFWERYGCILEYEFVMIIDYIKVVFECYCMDYL